MPTQREASPEEPLGALGRTRVEVDSRMKEFEATGPVLKAGPMAAFTEAIAIMARAEIVCLVKGISDKIHKSCLNSELFLVSFTSNYLARSCFILSQYSRHFPFRGWGSLPLSGGIHTPSCNIHRKFQVISTNKDSNPGAYTDRIGAITVCSSIN